MADLRIILLEDISKLGHAGDIVVVSEGYARNALFPDGRAALATEQVKRKANERRFKEKKQVAERLRQLQEVADVLEGTELTLTAKVKEGTEIFGSITVKQLAQELKERAHLDIIPSNISLKTPIKEIGTYPITIALSPEVECKIIVQVIPDAASQLKKNNNEE